VTEVYQAMREERPWRPALAPDEATRQLRNEIAARRLDASAVDAVLTAAGQPGLGSRSATAWPAKLTDREVDVLRVLAVGLPNKHIALELHVSEATVKTHIVNIYGKIGVNTRAGATLFALEHDLLDGSGRVSVESRRRPAGFGGSGR
jgi:DNA-binding NarL/FixJ family response regulator